MRNILTSVVLANVLACSLVAKEVPMTTSAIINTNLGSMEFELFQKEAPKACENFITLAQRNYYDGIIFHRVIKNFMVQCGDPTGTGRGGESCWGKPFEDEFAAGRSFDGSGLLAMANRGPNTNGSQFFVTTVACPWLNKKHTIFGRLISGADVLKAIEASATDSSDRPVKAVTISSVTIRKADAE